MLRCRFRKKAIHFCFHIGGATSLISSLLHQRKQSHRTYAAEPRNYNELEATTSPSGNILQVVPGALSIHSQHSEQMKPHQVEGLNFLIKNLADENNPGGCILAHAPGSGKTFMLISFVQSFLARYPAGRPLIILPKGILATWRTEFVLRHIKDMHSLVLEEAGKATCQPS